jgi:hypothetical protein
MMDNYRGAEAVHAVVKRLGQPGLPDYVADAIVEAVHAQVDGQLNVQQVANREVWEDERYRTHLRSYMRRELANTVADQGVLPAELPRETLTYMTLQYGSATQIPNDVVEAGADWNQVTVTLEVGCRLPVIDRAQAVKAGIL